MSVSLSKGQSVSLAKAGGSTLTRVAMGLGWDAAKKEGFLGKFMGGGDIDLDASCLVFDAGGVLIDQVWFHQLKSGCGAIVHSGDNRTGDGDGDDEVITIDLTRLPAAAKTLVFTVNSFTSQTFDDVANATCRLVDQSAGGRELVRYTLSGGGRHTAQIMAKLTRQGDDWTMTAIGAPAHGRVFADMMNVIRPHL